MTLERRLGKYRTDGAGRDGNAGTEDSMDISSSL